jgi:hypothetical protein
LTWVIDMDRGLGRVPPPRRRARAKPPPLRLVRSSFEPQERLQAEGNVIAAKGKRKLEKWLDELSGDDIAVVSVAMHRRWQEIAQQAERAP